MTTLGFFTVGGTNELPYKEGAPVTHGREFRTQTALAKNCSACLEAYTPLRQASTATYTECGVQTYVSSPNIENALQLDKCASVCGLPPRPSFGTGYERPYA